MPPVRFRAPPTISHAPASRRAARHLDIADGRDFVAGIGALDAAARGADVAVISGASSVPALSGAVLRELTPGFDDLSAIEMAISASNRATAQASVGHACDLLLHRPADPALARPALGRRIWLAGSAARGFSRDRRAAAQRPPGRAGRRARSRAAAGSPAWASRSQLPRRNGACAAEHLVSGR